ncbi:hypothetical protein BDW22DRAFT_1428221 [Trametopsis cervina]|nr:hypothetical protein BDW22DRAFT_1428221 [Trametopsis cervina]
MAPTCSSFVYPLPLHTFPNPRWLREDRLCYMECEAATDEIEACLPLQSLDDQVKQLMLQSVPLHTIGPPPDDAHRVYGCEIVNDKIFENYSQLHEELQILPWRFGGDRTNVQYRYVTVAEVVVHLRHMTGIRTLQLAPCHDDADKTRSILLLWDSAWPFGVNITQAQVGKIVEFTGSQPKWWKRYVSPYAVRKTS